MLGGEYIHCLSYARGRGERVDELVDGRVVVPVDGRVTRGKEHRLHLVNLHTPPDRFEALVLLDHLNDEFSCL